jgi:hypothetical protein
LSGFFTFYKRVKKRTLIKHIFHVIFLLRHIRMSQQLRFRAVPERAYARQHHLSGNETTPTIAFHDVPTSGMYLDNEPSGELGFTVKGTRKLLVGNGVRIDGNLIVDGAIIGGDGNTIVPIVDFGNIDHHIVPGAGSVYTIGTEDRRYQTLFVDDVNVSHDIDIVGNLTVSGNTTFQVGFDRVDVDLLPISNVTYSLGSTDLQWTNVHVQNVVTSSVNTDTIDAQTASVNSLDTVQANIVSIDANSIVSNVIQTTTLLNAQGEEFVKIDLTRIDSNINPVSNAVYSIGNTGYQWDTVHTRRIRASEYLLDSGDPLEFPVDFGNIDQSVIPVSNETYSIGSETKQWESIWSNTLQTNIIRTSTLLDLNGNTFIPEVDYTGIQSNITPLETATYSIGNTTHRWDTVWATDLVGNLDASQLYGNLSGDIVLNGTVTLNGVATIEDGNESNPSLAFANEPNTGMYRPQSNSIAFSTGGVQRLVITDSATISAVFGDANTVYYGDATNMTFPADRLQVSNVQVTDSNFVPVDETAVDANVTGYVTIYGTSFELGAMTVRFGQALSNAVSVIDYSEIHATVPPLTAGSYDVVVTKNGSQSATLPNGLLVSNIPSWNTDTNLGYIFANIAYERQVSASEGTSTIVYEDDPGGAYPLPPTSTLTTTGLLSGNITQDIQNTSTSYTFNITARDEEQQETVRPFTLNYLSEFATGDKTASSLLLLSRNLGPSSVQIPQSGIGTITVGGQYISPYEVTLKKGDQNVTSFVNSDWFTNVDDARCTIIKVFGHMNIPSGITFRPNARKLFTVLHVTGDLILNGTLSMSERGANHAGGITAKNVQVWKDVTYNSITDAYISATGTTGGAAVTSNAAAAGVDGASASPGAILQSGGGGSGGVYNNGAYNPGPTSGSGAPGSSFSGGPGGGGIYVVGTYSGASGGNGTLNGGSGGNGVTSGLSASTAAGAGGGAGNPGGIGGAYTNPSFLDGSDGTGGILIVIVDGTITGSGTIEARGGAGGTYNSILGVSGGGGSGGGIVVLMAKTNSSSVTLDASGGPGGIAYGDSQAVGGTPPGGKGGDGGDGSTLTVTF